MEGLLFKDVSDNELEEYIKKYNGKRMPYQKGETIFFKDDAPDYFYVLIDGIIEIEKTSYDGRRVLVSRFTKPGAVFAEVYAHRGIPFDYDAIAGEDSMLLRLPDVAISFKDLHDPIEQKIAQNFIQLLSLKAYTLNQRILLFSEYSIRQKIAVYLLQQRKQITEDLFFNREELADYLGVSRPSLSRELMNMQRDKLIAVNKSKITFDSEQLEELL